MEDGWILLGKVTKPHGLKGEVKIFPYSGDPYTFAATYERLYLTPDRDAAPREYEVSAARTQGRFALIRLQGVNDRTAAEHLAGLLVYVRESQLPELDSDEFYLHELQGRDLVDPQGSVLGRISHLLDTAGHDILVVRQGKKEFLVPVVGEYIVRIEPDRVVMDLPPGLVEING